MDHSATGDSQQAGEETPAPPPADTTSKWVSLNVGGTVFMTTRSTLVNNAPNSMLACMFGSDQRCPSDRDANGAYLIDRSGTYFEPVLNYLRHGQLIRDDGCSLQGILEEARFYGIDSLVEHLETEIAAGNRLASDFPLTRRDVINSILQTPHTSELRFQGVNLAGADLSKLDLRNINFKVCTWCVLEREIDRNYFLYIRPVRLSGSCRPVDGQPERMLPGTRRSVLRLSAGRPAVSGKGVVRQHGGCQYARVQFRGPQRGAHVSGGRQPEGRLLGEQQHDMRQLASGQFEECQFEELQFALCRVGRCRFGGEC